MKIKINNNKLISEDAEDLINHILQYVKTAAKEYNGEKLFYQGLSQAYSEISDTIYCWNLMKEAGMNKNLKEWAAGHLHCAGQKGLRLKIILSNPNLNTTDIEDLITRIFQYAQIAANKYDAENIFSQGVAQAYSETLDVIHNWNIIKEAGINRNLGKWAAKHLA